MAINKAKYTCGSIIPSSCVPYTGNQELSILPYIFPTEETPELPCNANINDVLDLFDTAIDTLVIYTDLTELVPGDIDFDPATVTTGELFTLILEAVETNDAEIASVAEQLSDFSVEDALIGIDLGELAPAAAACAAGVNSYPLLNILILFVNKIIELEERIEILEQ